MDMLVSVIIPVYNTAPYLRRCVGSVQENTHKNLEIICVNDGSTDNSLEVLKEMAASDSRIKVIDKPNGGVSSARNTGLDAATGEYVAFVDSDDWVHISFFEVLLRNAATADMIIGNYVNNSTGDDSERRVPLPNDVDAEVLSVDEAISDGYIRCSPCGRLFRRAFIDSKRFPDGIQYGEDAIFNVVLLSKQDNVKIIRVAATVFYYYNRPNSLVHTVAVDTFRLISNSFLEHTEGLYRKDFCIYQAFRMALMYRYQGLLTKKKKEVKKLASLLLRKCRKYLLKEKRIAMATKAKLLIASFSASLYRWTLIRKDKSYLQLEQKLKNM